jgi:formate dehydrogenase
MYLQLHYTDRHRLPEAVEKELNLTHHAKVEDMVKVSVCSGISYV